MAWAKSDEIGLFQSFLCQYFSPASHLFQHDAVLAQRFLFDARKPPPTSHGDPKMFLGLELGMERTACESIFVISDHIYFGSF